MTIKNLRPNNEVRIVYHDFGAAQPYQFIILDAAEQYDIEPEMIAAIIITESCYAYTNAGKTCTWVNPWAYSSTRDRGLMQINEAHYNGKNPDLFYNPSVNIHTGARLFREALNARNQNIYLALSAYNTGTYSPFIQHRYARKTLDYYAELKEKRKVYSIYL